MTRRRLPAFWSARADADLDEIYSYMHKESPAAAADLAAALLDTLENLEEFPQMGEQVPGRIADRNYRSLGCRRYRIYYRVEKERLVVVRLWDTRRNPSRLALDEQ